MSSLFGYQLFKGFLGSRITFSGLFFGSGKFYAKTFHGGRTICVKHTHRKTLA